MSVEPGGTTDEIPPADLAPTSAVSGAAPGELLRVERERRGWSVQQAADELHLDARLISAIESNNFLVLGAPVYARGHLRKYASVLGLSPDVVIDHYQTLADVPAVPTVMPLSASPPRERVSLRVPGWVVMTLLVGAIAWWLAAWLLDRRDAGEPAAASGNVAMPVVVGSEPDMSAPDGSSNGQMPLAPQPAQSPSTQPSSTQPGSTQSGSIQPGTTQSETVQLETSQSAMSAAAINELTMQLQFAAASWAEVYDASDKRLMFGIGQPGQTRRLSGRPPLTVNLGLASAVSMQVNDRPVAIPRRAGKDATRFKVAADGSVG